MPRFYFDVHGLHGLAVDEVGGEFVDAEDAQRDALELLPDLLRNERLDGQACMLDVTLRDETGRVVLITSLSLSTHVPEPVVRATVAETALPAPAPREEPDPADDPTRRAWSVRHRGLTEACAETAMLLSTTRRLLGRISTS